MNIFNSLYVHSRSEFLRHYHPKEGLVVLKKRLTNTESIGGELRSEKVKIEGIVEQEVV